jgi:hypothetical protein
VAAREDHVRKKVVRGIDVASAAKTGAVSVLPIVYGVLGTIGLTIVSLVYDAAAGLIGGLELDLA